MGSLNKFLGFTLLLAGLAMCGTGLWLLARPAQYRATARIAVDDNDIIGMSGPPHDSSSYDPYFIQIEFEVIQSQTVLDKVIKSLNLNAEWGKKYSGDGTLTSNTAIAILKRHLQIALVRNTKLIEISYTSRDPNEAARIANAIAEAYQDYRVETQRQMTLKGIEVLNDEYQKEQRSIDAKLKELDQLRIQLNVPKPKPVDELLETNYPSYFKARQEAQKMIDFHKLVQAKIESEKLDLQGPKAKKTSMLQIVDAAQPPESPAGPNRFLGAALFVIGLFPTIGGWMLLESPRRPSV